MKTEQRFLSKILKTDSCWIWQGQPMTIGYGYFYFDNKDGYAHRYSYQYFKGAIPNGLTIDHLCRNRICVNPNHLEAVTMGENSRRGGGLETANANRRQRTHCTHGHEYTESNTYDARGFRECRQCRHEANVKQRSKNVIVIS